MQKCDACRQTCKYLSYDQITIKHHPGISDRTTIIKNCFSSQLYLIWNNSIKEWIPRVLWHDIYLHAYIHTYILSVWLKHPMNEEIYYTRGAMDWINQPWQALPWGCEPTTPAVPIAWQRKANTKRTAPSHHPEKGLVDGPSHALIPSDCRYPIQHSLRVREIGLWSVLAVSPVGQHAVPCCHMFFPWVSQ